MGLAKKIGQIERIRALLCWLVAQYIRLIWLTGRWRVVDGDIPAHFWDQGKPFILCFWHGRLMLTTKCWRLGHPLHMLISQHRDGQLIARTVAHLGTRTIAGSTTRGGAGAMRAILKALKAGECVGITPDGPKGPRMRATDGVISTSRLSGCPIIPVCASSAGQVRLKSWDRFHIPLPFRRGVVVWGEPIQIPRDLDEAGIEEWRARLESVMNAQAEQADRLVGEAPVAPA